MEAGGEVMAVRGLDRRQQLACPVGALRTFTNDDLTPVFDDDRRLTHDRTGELRSDARRLLGEGIEIERLGQPLQRMLTARGEG
jgi:hypothetical protein